VAEGAPPAREYISKKGYRGFDPAPSHFCVLGFWQLLFERISFESKGKKAFDSQFQSLLRPTIATRSSSG